MHSETLKNHINQLVVLEGDHDRSPQKLVCYSGFYMVVWSAEAALGVRGA